MGVTNHVLTGMILQVRGPGGSRLTIAMKSVILLTLLPRPPGVPETWGLRSHFFSATKKMKKKNIH